MKVLTTYIYFQYVSYKMASLEGSQIFPFRLCVIRILRPCTKRKRACNGQCYTSFDTSYRNLQNDSVRD